jgi:hypothetical protein
MYQTFQELTMIEVNALTVQRVVIQWRLDLNYLIEEAIRHTIGGEMDKANHYEGRIFEIRSCIEDMERLIGLRVSKNLTEENSYEDNYK